MAIWGPYLSVLDRGVSLTQNVILSQGAYSLQSLIQSIDTLYALLNFMPQLRDSYIHPDIPRVMVELCAHQGIASDILLNDSEQAVREKDYPYKLRVERGAYVKTRCDARGISTAILSNRSVRNRLIHADDYLARQMNKPGIGWHVNSAMAHRDQFTPPPKSRKSAGVGALLPRKKPFCT